MDQDFYINLIHQDLRGILPKEGQQQLNAWRLAAPENPGLEDQTRKSWKLSQQYEPELKVDTTAAYNSLRTRVRAHEKANTATVRTLSPTRSGRRTWLGIAASLLVLLTAGWFLWPSAPQAGPMASIETKVGDAPREVTLADGSKIWLRENSRLEYPETFASSSREVTLTGEAFFDVAKKTDAPFRIALADKVEVEVLGTSFLVSAQADSLVKVNVNTGKVALNVSNKVLLLYAGKAGSANPSTGAIAELNYQPNAAAWRNNTLVFDDKPLGEVVLDLEAYFKVDIYLSSDQLLKCRFAGRFPNANLENILDAIEQTLGVSWDEFEGEYQLRNGDCQ